MTPFEQFKADFEAAGNDVDDLEGYEVVKKGSWELDFKDYASKEIVVKDKLGNFFLVVQCRTGSYYSDYDYEDPEVFEVVPVERTIIEYAVVKQ